MIKIDSDRSKVDDDGGHERALKSIIDKSDMGMNCRFGRLLPPLTLRKCEHFVEGGADEGKGGRGGRAGT